MTIDTAAIAGMLTSLIPTNMSVQVLNADIMKEVKTIHRVFFVTLLGKLNLPRRSLKD